MILTFLLLCQFDLFYADLDETLIVETLKDFCFFFYAFRVKGITFL